MVFLGKAGKVPLRLGWDTGEKSEEDHPGTGDQDQLRRMGRVGVDPYSRLTTEFPEFSFVVERPRQLTDQLGEAADLMVFG